MSFFKVKKIFAIIKTISFFFFAVPVRYFIVLVSIKL